MRPKAMKILDDFTEQNIFALEHAKQHGKKIIGFYCGFAPLEIIVAAGAIPVGLCGTKEAPIPEAERMLPRNLCPLIKSSFGFAITNTCPFFRLSDLIVAETTCDGKKKMFELLKEYKPMHVMYLPPGTEHPSAKTMWMAEVRMFKEVLERFCGVEITREAMWDAIRIFNLERRTMKALHELNRDDPAPLSGLDTLRALLLIFFNADKEHGIGVVEQLIAEVKDSQNGCSPFAPGTPRILLTGCPVSIGSEKVVTIAEECGASVVCYEMCTGSRGFALVDENEEADPIEAIVNRHLTIPCACMSPNPGRPQLIDDLVRDYHVDGIIDLTWHTCHTFAVEDEVLQRHNRERWRLPFLHVETDYSLADVEQLKTRISAFVEMMHANKKENPK